MARYRSRTRPFHVPVMREDHTNDREDSGVQLDEPSSPFSRHMDNNEAIKPTNHHPRHGVTITKINKNNTDMSENIATKQSPLRSRRHISHIDDKSKRGQGHLGGEGRSSLSYNTDMVVNETVRLKLCDNNSGDKMERVNDDHNTILKSRSNHGGQSQIKKCHSQDIKLSMTLNLDEDEGFDIRDSNSDINRGDNSYTDCLHVDTDTSGDNNSDSENVGNVQFYLDGKTNNKLEDNDKHKGKETKKRRFRKFMRQPVLRRSQSVGCETDLVVPEHALFLQCNPGESQTEKKPTEQKEPRRTIHKTCSADAAMMAKELLPLDPQDLVKNKQKSSIAKNMRKKLQKLRRRNTDSLLGAALLSVRGGSKVSMVDAVEWGNSFDSLLSDKNGLELFKNFLKSEFSEENIEFWIACEEFKTIRTNKLVARAQKIYSDFVAIKAPKQVNLDSKTRLETVTHLENPTRDLFKQAQKRIQFLMENDSYKRFLESEDYKQLIRPSTVSSTMMAR